MLDTRRKKLPRLVIFGNPKKERVAEAIEEFIAFSKGKAETITPAAACAVRQGSSVEKYTTGVLKKCDFAVVFGGDGAIISAARTLSQSKVPVIGVNLGKLGFLAEFSINELEEFFDDIISGKACIERRMMLNCRVFRRGRERFGAVAVNDVFITAGAPFRTIELKMAIDGQPIAGCMSDGVIISTPTGSTAYNLSAGGPILSGKMEAMVITPICPHSLSFRPIVIKADSVAEVFGVQVNKGTTVSVDGQTSCRLSVADVVRVQREKGDFLVVNNPLRTQWDTLAAKLNWAGRPKYKMI